MSHFDYIVSKRLGADDPPFASLIMAAIRKADTKNAEILRHTFPAIHAELQARYNAPGGVLDDEYEATP